MRSPSERSSERMRMVLIGVPGHDMAAEWDKLGVDVEIAPTLGEAVRALRDRPPDAALILANNASAAQMCAVVSELGHFAVGVLPEPLSEGVAIECLESGADFALTSPVPVPEMVARIRAAARRNAGTPNVVRSGNVTINLGRYEVTRDGAVVAMSRTEFRLLAELAIRSGEIVPVSELLRAVWGEQFIDEVHYVRLYIGYLRSKLEEDPAHPTLIVTRRGEGYQLVLAEARGHLR